MEHIMEYQRVGVFIDVQNMYYSAKALFGKKVDFGKVLELGLADRTLVRAIAYVIKSDSGQEKPFFEALEERGLELRAKDLQTFYDGNKKGDWDVGIAMDIMRMASKLDVVVLVSGDGDFAELMKHVKALGCRAEAMSFGESSSSLLREEVDEFVDLSKFSKDILINTSKKRTSRSASSATKRTKSASKSAKSKTKKKG